MTAPSLTYGHGYLNDCDSTTGWVEATGGSISATSFTVEHGDIYKIGGTCNDGANEYVYRYKDISASSISTTTYSHYAIRYKTSAGSAALGACVKISYTDASSEWILGSDTLPLFSTTWKLVTGTLTTGKTVKEIYFQADDYPDSTASGASNVYYDFLLLHKGTFTFPHCHVLPVEFENVYADLHPPGRVGEIQQYVGMKSPTIMLEGKLDIGTDSSWGVPPLEYIYRVFQEAHQDPWQWFSTGGLEDSDRVINCKVTPRTFRLIMDRDSGAVRGWRILLKHYSLSSGAESTWSDLQWLGI